MAKKGGAKLGLPYRSFVIELTFSYTTIALAQGWRCVSAFEFNLSKIGDESQEHGAVDGVAETAKHKKVFPVIFRDGSPLLESKKIECLYVREVYKIRKRCEIEVRMGKSSPLPINHPHL